MYKLKTIVDSYNFSAQFIKIISHYKKIGYNINARDLFHVYLNRFEFHFLRLHINETNIFFSCIQGVSMVLPNRQDDNLKHSHNTVTLTTSPSPFN